MWVRARVMGADEGWGWLGMGSTTTAHTLALVAAAACLTSHWNTGCLES